MINRQQIKVANEVGISTPPIDSPWIWISIDHRGTAEGVCVWAHHAPNMALFIPGYGLYHLYSTYNKGADEVMALGGHDSEVWPHTCGVPPGELTPRQRSHIMLP